MIDLIAAGFLFFLLVKIEHYRNALREISTHDVMCGSYISARIAREALEGY